jgi:Flp pilus assembly protein TadD
MERCEEAIPHFERAVEAAPNFVEALSNLAQAYDIVGRSREADEMRVRAEAMETPR